jgi:cyanophycinase
MAGKTGNGKVGALVIIGGAEEKEDGAEILEEFLRLAGGEKAHLVIMPVATDHPQEMGKKYTDAFSQLGCPEIEAIDVSTREMAFEGQREEALRRATGIFFTGGSQVRISSLLRFAT